MEVSKSAKLKRLDVFQAARVDISDENTRRGIPFDQTFGNRCVERKSRSSNWRCSKVAVLIILVWDLTVLAMKDTNLISSVDLLYEERRNCYMTRDGMKGNTEFKDGGTQKCLCWELLIWDCFWR